METTNIIIVGAAGRDFHDFLVYWKHQPVNVVCFTAAQIPGIDHRIFPTELAGEKYPNGIPILEEARLEELIAEHNVTKVAFAYSDVHYTTLGHLESRVQAAGAEFVLLPPKFTQIKSTKPVLSVLATRTGVGKSQVSRYLCYHLKQMGLTPVVLRHPMPYDQFLNKQVVQRFATVDDLKKYDCTIEEMEEYELHIQSGTILYAGVDYEACLRQAEKEADVIIWDGGNNDFSFFQADMTIVCADPHRVGHESLYYPAEINCRNADMFLINKVNTVDSKAVEQLTDNLKQLNPKASVVCCASVFTPHIDNELCDMGVFNIEEMGECLQGKTVLCVDDGPTITHGSMPNGAAVYFAKEHGVTKFCEPRDSLSGSLKGVFEKYSHIEHSLPAMGYSTEQRADLEKTIADAKYDVLIVGTPIDLSRVINLPDKPRLRVFYDLKPASDADTKLLAESLDKMKATTVS